MWFREGVHATKHTSWQSYWSSKRPEAIVNGFSAFIVWQYVRNWVCKYFYWKCLSIWGLVLPVFPEHNLPYRGLCREFLSEWILGQWWQYANDLILVELGGLNILYYTILWLFPSKFQARLGRHFWPSRPWVLGMLIPRRGEDFLYRPLGVLILNFC